MSASESTTASNATPRAQIDWQDLSSKMEPVFATLDRWLLEQSHKRRSIFQHGGIMALAGLAGSLVAWVATQSTVAMMPAIVFFVIAGLYLIIRLGGIQSEYKSLYKNEVFKRVTSWISPGVNYEPSRFVSQNLFEQSGLFSSRIDRYHGEDFFSGQVGQTNLLWSELHVERKETSRDSKGNTSTRWVTVFKGLYAVFDFHKEFHGTTIIQTDVAESMFGWLGRKMQNLGGDLVRLENPEFEKAFKVRSSDQIEARYLLTPSMQERMLALRLQWGAQIQFCLSQSFLYIAIPQSRDWFEPPAMKSLNHHQSIQHFAAQLISLLDIVSELDLNTRLWTKE